MPGLAMNPLGKEMLKNISVTQDTCKELANLSLLNATEIRSFNTAKLSCTQNSSSNQYTADGLR